MSEQKKPKPGSKIQISINESLKNVVPTYKIKTPPPKPKTGQK